MEKKISINCEYSSEDYISFEFLDDGQLKIESVEGGDVLYFFLKRKEAFKFLNSLQNTLKEGKNKRRASFSYKAKGKNCSNGQEITFSLNITREDCGTILEEGNDWANTRCRVHNKTKNLEEIAEFLLKNMKEKDDMIMETVVKMNCLEEENDSVLVLDCNKGKNVVIETDIDHEKNLIFLTVEDAIKMAKTILEKYDNK